MTDSQTKLPEAPLESLSYFPGYARAELEADSQHPVRGLLEPFETNLHRAEQAAAESRMLLDPAKIAFLFDSAEAKLWKRGDWELEFLEWLSSWLVLELDDDWLIPRGESGVPAGVAEDCGGSRFPKLCNVIQQAAAVYRQRGTPHGLKKMLELFYGWKVEIIEHAWPQGMIVGGNSILNSGCWLMDEPALEQSFVIIILSNGARPANSPEPGTRITSALAGQAQPSIDWLLGNDESPSPVLSDGTQRKWLASITKLREAIDREKPAHTRYFLALKSMPQKKPEPPTLRPMIIGVSSIIENFWVN